MTRHVWVELPSPLAGYSVFVAPAQVAAIEPVDPGDFDGCRVVLVSGHVLEVADMTPGEVLDRFAEAVTQFAQILAPAS
jgi:hypothetical protein